MAKRFINKNLNKRQVIRKFKRNEIPRNEVYIKRWADRLGLKVKILNDVVIVDHNSNEFYCQVSAVDGMIELYHINKGGNKKGKMGDEHFERAFNWWFNCFDSIVTKQYH